MGRPVIQTILALLLTLAMSHSSKGGPNVAKQTELKEQSDKIHPSSMENSAFRATRDARRKSHRGKKENNRNKKKTDKSGQVIKKIRKNKTGQNKKNRLKLKKKGKKNKKKLRKNKKKSWTKKKRPNKGKQIARRNRNKSDKKKSNQNKKELKKTRKKLVQEKLKKNELLKWKSKQACDETVLCQKIKDYIKYSNQLRKVKRIMKSCETMEKKANKSSTEFEKTVAALDEVINANAKRKLYIKWRRAQRSTDEVTEIRDTLKNCSLSVKAKCEKKVEPACGETALLNECEAALQDWLNKFGPSKGSCLQASTDCCACITALSTVDAKCLDFDTKSTNTVKSKKKCTSSTESGSFGFCRKQQQEAAVKGPPAACGGKGPSKYKLCNNYNGTPNCTLNGIGVALGYCCPLTSSENPGHCPPLKSGCGVIGDDSTVASKYKLCNNYNGTPNCTLNGIGVALGYCCPLTSSENPGHCPPLKSGCGVIGNDSTVASKYKLCNNYNGTPNCTLNGLGVALGYCCPLTSSENPGHCPPLKSGCGVIGDDSTVYKCGTEISDDCQQEYDNAKNNGKLDEFYKRCKEEGGANPLRDRCSLCCP